MTVIRCILDNCSMLVKGGKNKTYQGQVFCFRLDRFVIKEGSCFAYVRPVLALKFKLLYGQAGQSKFGLVARAQCYKTFYGRNFQMFVISWGVCA